MSHFQQPIRDCINDYINNRTYLPDWRNLTGFSFQRFLVYITISRQLLKCSNTRRLRGNSTRGDCRYKTVQRVHQRTKMNSKRYSRRYSRRESCNTSLGEPWKIACIAKNKSEFCLNQRYTKLQVDLYQWRHFIVLLNMFTECFTCSYSSNNESLHP